MAEYIERKQALDRFTYEKGDMIPEALETGEENTVSIKSVKAVLRSLPAADVALVVHGHWIYRGEEKGYQCSVCQSFCLLNYESDWCASECCPHCGAKMDGDSKEVKK